MGSIPVARLCLKKSASLSASISNGLFSQKNLFLQPSQRYQTIVLLRDSYLPFHTFHTFFQSATGSKEPLPERDWSEEPLPERDWSEAPLPKREWSAEFLPERDWSKFFEKILLVWTVFV